MSSQEKTVILLSGGMDSAVAAYSLKQQEIELYALTFTANFYKTSRIETDCAKKIASILGIRHTIVDFSCLSTIIDIDYFNKVDSYAMTHVRRRDIAVPFGAELMLMSAIMYASYNNVKKIVWAIQFDDIGKKSADSIEKYISLFDKLIKIKRLNQCRIETPFLRMKKSEVAILGLKLNVPFDITFSCLVEADKLVHCGVCEQCLQRNFALIEARKNLNIK